MHLVEFIVSWSAYNAFPLQQPLHQYIKRYVSLTPEELAIFDDHLEKRTYEKRTFLLREGSICRHKFFILEGLLRTYYIDGNGQERITQFGKELWWVTDMESYVSQSLSRVYIQALEKTTAMVISKDQLEEVYRRVPKIERLFRIITERWLVAQQRNNNFYMKASSKERYNTLVTSIPNFVQRVPQYMIASYLDMTPEYLSELRKSKG